LGKALNNKRISDIIQRKIGDLGKFLGYYEPIIQFFVPNFIELLKAGDKNPDTELFFIARDIRPVIVFPDYSEIEFIGKPKIISLVEPEKGINIKIYFVPLSYTLNLPMFSMHMQQNFAILYAITGAKTLIPSIVAKHFPGGEISEFSMKKYFEILRETFPRKMGGDSFGIFPSTAYTYGYGIPVVLDKILEVISRFLIVLSRIGTTLCNVVTFIERYKASLNEETKKILEKYGIDLTEPAGPAIPFFTLEEIPITTMQRIEKMIGEPLSETEKAFTFILMTDAIIKALSHTLTLDHIPLFGVGASRRGIVLAPLFQGEYIKNLQKMIEDNEIKAIVLAYTFIKFTEFIQKNFSRIFSLDASTFFLRIYDSIINSLPTLSQVKKKLKKEIATHILKCFENFVNSCESIPFHSYDLFMDWFNKIIETIKLMISSEKRLKKIKDKIAKIKKV